MDLSHFWVWTILVASNKFGGLFGPLRKRAEGFVQQCPSGVFSVMFKLPLIVGGLDWWFGLASLCEAPEGLFGCTRGFSMK